LAGPQARAQFHTGPIAAGAGGAGRAAVDPSEASFLNPASLSFIKNYNLAAGYQASDHPLAGHRAEFSGMISDATENGMVPGSLAYSHRYTEPPLAASPYTEEDVAVAISRVVMPHIALGLGAHRQLYMPSVGSTSAQNNATLGALWAPSSVVGVAAVAYDILPVDPDPGMPDGSKQKPTYAVGLFAQPLPFLRLRADVVRPTEGLRNGRTNAMLGLESQFHPEFLFRLGAEWLETEDQTVLTAGLGWHGPRLSLEYAFQKDVRVDGGFRHLIDLWLPL
jgi:hypothetical protein